MIWGGCWSSFWLWPHSKLWVSAPLTRLTHLKFFRTWRKGVGEEKTQIGKGHFCHVSISIYFGCTVFKIVFFLFRQKFVDVLLYVNDCVPQILLRKDSTLLDQSVWNSKHSWKRKNKQSILLFPPIFCIKISKITLRGPKKKKELTHN